jgi:hypothetical protein
VIIYPCSRRKLAESDHRLVSIAWRLISAVPPILASTLVSDLMYSLQAAGLCGIVVALVVPSLLQRQLSFRGSLIPVSMTSIIPLDTQFNQQLFSSGALCLAAVAMAVSVFQIVHH